MTDTAPQDIRGLTKRLRLFPEAYDILTRQEMRDAKGNWRSLIDQQTKALADIRASIPLVETQAGWKPITNDTAGVYLVCSAKDIVEGDYAVETMQINEPSDPEHRFFNLNSGNYSRPDWWTHFMPLPAPPAQAVENEG